MAKAKNLQIDTKEYKLQGIEILDWLRYNVDISNEGGRL